jgi:hypothetical protein
VTEGAQGRNRTSDTGFFSVVRGIRRWPLTYVGAGTGGGSVRRRPLRVAFVRRRECTSGVLVPCPLCGAQVSKSRLTASSADAALLSRRRRRIRVRTSGSSASTSCSREMMDGVDAPRRGPPAERTSRTVRTSKRGWSRSFCTRTQPPECSRRQGPRDLAIPCVIVYGGTRAPLKPAGARPASVAALTPTRKRFP